MDVQGCPICWRAFTAELQPVCFPCGHSFCSECASLVKLCSMCRQRLPSSFQRRPNYALVALLERQQAEHAKDLRDQATQTDEEQQTMLLEALPPRRPPPEQFFKDRVLSVQMRRGGITFTFK
jgi:hypothetical protein